METYIHQQNLEHYRRLIAESQIALTKHRVRHNELLRLLLEEEAKGQVEPIIQETKL
jgi:cell division protein FtsL